MNAWKFQVGESSQSPANLPPWWGPAIIFLIFSLWSLDMGLNGGTSKQTHQRLPPNPMGAATTWFVVSIPLLGAMAYLWHHRPSPPVEEKPGSLVLAEQRMWVLDAAGMPTTVWEADYTGPRGALWQKVELTPEGLRATFQEPGPLGSAAVANQPVPAAAKGTIEPLVEALNQHLGETYPARVEALKSEPSPAVLVRQLGPHTFVSTTLQPLPFPLPLGYAGVGCLGYLTLMPWLLVGFALSDPSATDVLHGPALWVAVGLGLAMLAGLIVGAVKLVRMRVRHIHIRLSPEQILVDPGAGQRRFEATLPAASEIRTRGSNLIMGLALPPLANLPEPVAARLALALTQALAG